MANQKYVKILKQGVEVWNKWIAANSEIEIDLTGIDLIGANLKGIDFYGALLNGANLAGADLEGAKLNEADLEGADLVQAKLNHITSYWVNLRNANLQRAYIANADLAEADLRHTDFRYAEFYRVDLSEAKLYGADFSNSIIQMVNFSGVDLSKTNGLNKVLHYSPSSIDTRTLILSGGNIPEVFLRGSGCPDIVIEYINSLANAENPITYYSCFISYSYQDRRIAERLYNDLQTKGVRCWFAPHDMKIGDKIRPRIDESIRLYDKLLLILSKYSVSSQWVEHEVETAIGKELEGKPNVLFPIRLDDTVMESATGWASHVKLTRHIGDFTHWKNYDAYIQAFNRLLRDLKAASTETG